MGDQATRRICSEIMDYCKEILISISQRLLPLVCSGSLLLGFKQLVALSI